MQMLISIPFKDAVNLKSIEIDATLPQDSKDTSDMSTPSIIHLFKNRFHMDFDEAEDVSPDMTLELKPTDLKGNKRIKLKSTHFASVNCLTVFVASNQDEADVTTMRRITVFGTPVAGFSSMPKTLEEVQYRDGPCHQNTPNHRADRSGRL
mmetsp:Transcript_403/g.686  ORF Transcript_403/g.686 Transcript_403/m.686 type:complete len:151 (+) Transcript_403:560-1012(+)